MNSYFHFVVVKIFCKVSPQIFSHIASDKWSAEIEFTYIVMQETSDAHSKTADSDTVSTYQVSSVQLVTDKKLEAFNKA